MQSLTVPKHRGGVKTVRYSPSKCCRRPVISLTDVNNLTVNFGY